MVLTVSLAGVLTRHSVTGNMTITCNSSGVCWPAKRDRSRITQVMQSSLWPRFFILEVLLWKVSGMWGFKGFRKYCRAFTHALIFWNQSKSFPSRDALRPSINSRKCWLNFATAWPPWKIANWAKMCELVHVLSFFWAFLMTNFKHIQK